MRQPLGLCATLVTLILGTSTGPSAWAHGPAYPSPKNSEAVTKRQIQFPDTADYQTLVLDLHTHSVFSDGHVWPTVRVSEALRDGLDGLAITEHLEFQPHLDDIPNPDRNRAYEEALRAANGHPLTVIPGVEITRTGEPGHINAVFVTDANPLVRQATAADTLPSAEFPTKEGAFAFTVQQSPLFHGAHSVEVGGKIIWRPYPDPATYKTIMNFGLASSRDPREVLEAANEQKAAYFGITQNSSGSTRD